MKGAFRSAVLDLFYPPKCLICHRIMDSSRQTVCSACMDRLPEHDGADPQVRFAERCVATFFYEGDLRESFHRFKFGGLRAYATQYGRWMAVTVRDKLAGEFDLITWAPVSDKRRKQRGYDQSELLARTVAKELGMQPVRLLRKCRHTRPNSELGDASGRSANVAGVYEPLTPERFAGRRVLVIDDIVTTGATLSECSRVLLTAGAMSVVCAALAAARKHEKINYSEDYRNRG